MISRDRNERPGMTAMVTLQAFNARGELIDISGVSRHELYDGASDTVQFDYSKIGAAGQILYIVRTIRSGNLWDWDNDTSKRSRIAYFELHCSGPNFTSTVMESWITPWGRHCRVQLSGHVTQL